MSSYEVHKDWQLDREQRESALRPKYTLAQEKWDEHTRNLPKLVDGDKVFVQNQ